MLEKIYGLEKPTIHQCQEIAKDMGFDSTTFDLCGPTGKLKCRWLDAYFGLFVTDDNTDTFISVSQIEFVPDIWCENIEKGE